MSLMCRNVCLHRLHTICAQIMPVARNSANSCARGLIQIIAHWTFSSVVFHFACFLPVLDCMFCWDLYETAAFCFALTNSLFCPRQLIPKLSFVLLHGLIFLIISGSLRSHKDFLTWCGSRCLVKGLRSWGSKETFWRNWRGQLLELKEMSWACLSHKRDSVAHIKKNRYRLKALGKMIQPHQSSPEEESELRWKQRVRPEVVGYSRKWSDKVSRR